MTPQLLPPEPATWPKEQFLIAYSMALITERALPENFPHDEWSHFVLQDAHAAYPRSTPALSPKEHPHAENTLETVLSGFEDHLAAFITSDPVLFLATWVDRVLYGTSLLFATLTMSAVTCVCIGLYPVLAYIVSPLISLGIWLTPCFLYPVSDFIIAYQMVIDLLCELTLDGVVYGIDSFNRHRRHEYLRS